MYFIIQVRRVRREPAVLLGSRLLALLLEQPRLPRARVQVRILWRRVLWRTAHRLVTSAQDAESQGNGLVRDRK